MTNKVGVARLRSERCSVSNERGSALMITLMVMLLVFVLGSALTTSMLTEITTSAN